MKIYASCSLIKYWNFLCLHFKGLIKVPSSVIFKTLLICMKVQGWSLDKNGCTSVRIFVIQHTAGVWGLRQKVLEQEVTVLLARSYICLDLSCLSHLCAHFSFEPQKPLRQQGQHICFHLIDEDPKTYPGFMYTHSQINIVSPQLLSKGLIGNWKDVMTLFCCTGSGCLG